MELPEILVLCGRNVGKSVSLQAMLEANLGHYIHPWSDAGFSRKDIGSLYNPTIFKAIERHFAHTRPAAFPIDYFKQLHTPSRHAIGQVVHDKYTGGFRYVPNPGYEDQPVNLTITASAGRGTAIINGVETTIYDSSKTKIDLRLRPGFKVLTSFKKPRTLQ